MQEKMILHEDGIHTFLFLLTETVFASYIEVNRSGYADLTESEKLHVKPYTNDLITLKNNGFLYQVTTEQVKAYIQKEHYILVYEYLPFLLRRNYGGKAVLQQEEIKAFGYCYSVRRYIPDIPNECISHAGY